MASFTYSKLPSEPDTTRMLRLFPHKDRNAQIRGELIDYNLSSTDGRSHLYEALSYVWYDGEESSQEESPSIILNDCKFTVTPNLHAALLRLRNHQLERILWIDAICINQTDNDEKNKQIPLMRTIYAQASCVIVWLGEARDNSDNAFESIRRLAGDSINDRNSSKKFVTDEPAHDDDDACLMLLQRNWFRRIWVLQEVGVARCISLMCGHVEMNGYTFCKGFSKLELSSSLLRHVHPVIYLIRDAILRPKYRPDSRGTLSIGELIDMYQNHDATVQHDKVYALLGLSADDPRTPALKPNYALPWNDVLKQVTTYLFGGKCSVHTWPGSDMAVIQGKGWIFGYIDSVRRITLEDDRAYVSCVLNHTVDWLYSKSFSSDEWILRAPEELIQEGDIICLMQGTSTPSIIRLCKDHFEMVMTTITLLTRAEGIYDFQSLEWHSNSGFLYDILLTWRIPQNGAKNNIGLQDPVELINIAPEYQECAYAAETRLYNMALTVNNIVQMTLKNYFAVNRVLVLERILFQCAGGFPFSEDVVNAAAVSCEEAAGRFMEYLIQHQGESLPISEDVIKAAAAGGGNSGYEFIKYLTHCRGDSLPISEDVLKAAVRDTLTGQPLGYKILKLLLEHRGEDLPISEDVVKAAVSSKNAVEYLELLIQHQGESLPITENVVKAAAANASRRVMELLIQHRGESLPISEDVVKAAARNRQVRVNTHSGCEVLELLLEYRGEDLPITEDVVKAAAMCDGPDTLQALLNYRQNSLPITDDVIKAAAIGSWPQNLQFLLNYRENNNLPIPDDVVKAAAENCLPSNLPLLLQYQRGSLRRSEKRAKAAVANTDSICTIP
ncbi:heterokaryon incompatibility protein-domain-containing protein [Aspergillus sergii]|uniref:Heterokaryon incompatibility protein-domain-containing protein n=1 Tax=Aspergillus sergii TaxID=1034303 RepID=A0A5N6WRX1_9EURO|nr:heterokaryon incompatibility protein-domain-containing protein [Aspergillus sergii]